MVVLLSTSSSQMAPALVVRHALAARRLRLGVPGVQWNERAGRRIEQAIAAWPRVEQVQANVRTGHVLVQYAPGAPLLEQLREQPEPPRLRRGLRRPSARRDHPPWHALEVSEVLEILQVETGGLEAAEAERRLGVHGPNLLKPEQPPSKLELLGRQVFNLPTGLLLGSAGLSALVGDPVETAAILVVVGANAAIGYHMERKNQDLLASWRQLEAGQAQVLRSGVLRTLTAVELVPGDVLLLGPGDRVPADARMIRSEGLSCDEAPLTGESEPRPKDPDPVDAAAPLAERTSLLFAGTTVTSGHGRAVVVGTGPLTEVARVRSLVQEGAVPEDPLVRRMERLDRSMAVTAVASASLTLMGGLLHRRPVTRVMRSAVALGVATFPEGLPLVATSALVRSMQRLEARGLVVRRMTAAQTLGGVTLISADKTGTLTLNEMALEVLDTGEGPRPIADAKLRPELLFEDPTTLLLAAGVLNSDVDLLGEGSGARMGMTGSSTERALVMAALDAGLDPRALRKAHPRLELRGREPGIRYQVTVHRGPAGGRLAFLKGAPKQVLALCTATPSGPLGEVQRERMLASNEALANDGLRVLAVAWLQVARGKPVPAGGYTLLGLVGLRDRLRENAAETIQQARNAGIRTLIVTGDQKHTAEAVARQVGLKGLTRTTEELASLLENGHGELDEVAVVARVSPEDKLALVRALRARGEVVAMAGDGINDAPALKAADVGIAVGASANELAREVADVVMAGDDLRSLVAAVGEGRIVQDNLRRALRYLLATNLSELSLMLGASLIGLRDPLSPLQLLWINLLTDTLPGIALALEPGDPEVLDRAPPPVGGKLLSDRDVRQLVRDGATMAGLAAAGLAVGGRPVAFAALSASQLAYAVTCRAPRSATSAQERADGRFALLVGGGAALQLAGLTLPTLRRLLGLPRPGPLTLLATAAGTTLGLLLPGPALFHDPRFRRARVHSP